MRAGLGPQHVASVAVTVQAQPARVADRVEAGVDLGQCRFNRLLPGRPCVGRDDVGGQDPVARTAAVAGGVQRQPVGERPLHADCMHAADEAAQPLHRGLVLQLGRAAGAPLGDRETMVVVGGAEVAQGRGGAGLFARQGPRVDHRDLGGGQFGREGMLLQDLRIAPAAGAVELRDDHALVLQEDLEHAVLVGVQLDQPAVSAQADGVEGVEHHFRRQAGIGGLGRRGRRGK